MALQPSGTIYLSQINAEFARGYNLNAYRGTNYYLGSAGPYAFPVTPIYFSSFYSSRVSPSSTAGNQTYSTPGTYSFTVPTYATLTVYVDGGGGGGALSTLANGANGTSSTFNGSVVGGWGGGANIAAVGAAGSGSGGDTNTNGQPGTASTNFPNGGNAASGATGGGGIYITAGGQQLGTAPAPGGGGGGLFVGGNTGYGGGGSGRAVKSYTPGQLTPGGTITVVVGAGGAGGTGAGYKAGDGGAGQVYIAWT